MLMNSELGGIEEHAPPENTEINLVRNYGHCVLVSELHDCVSNFFVIVANCMVLYNKMEPEPELWSCP